MPESHAHPAPRNARFRAGIPAIVHYRGNDYPCRAFDLSRTGVRLQGGIPWPSEPQVRFRLDTPAGDRQLELAGTVVRIQEGETDSETVLALEFQLHGSEEKRLLESILQRVIEGHAPNLLDDIDPADPVDRIRRKLSRIPLPHRVNLAGRTGHPRERGILMQDPDPKVLDSLTRNPNLLARELRLLLKNNQLLPRTLEIIAADSRWLHDMALLSDLLAHPRSTLALAEKHLGRLDRKALQALMRKPGLPPGLQAKLRRRLGAG